MRTNDLLIFSIILVIICFIVSYSFTEKSVFETVTNNIKDLQEFMNDL